MATDKNKTSAAFLDQAVRAIDDAARRRILAALKSDRIRSDRSKPDRTRSATNKQGLCAGDIEERIHLSQPTISHHMAILTKAGLVDVVKQGQFRWYRRNEKALRQLIKSLRSQF